MIDLLTTLYCRLSKAKTIDHVLRRFVSPSSVNKAVREVKSEAELISRIAKEEGFSVASLRKEVATALGIDSAETVICPSSQILADLGLSVLELRNYRCLPQSVKNGKLVLALADLSITRTDYLKNKNVSLLLVPEEVLQPVYAHLDISTRAQQMTSFEMQDIQGIVTQLAVDAKAIGASEVFIGTPSPEQYEFVVNERRYSGGLHPEVCLRLVSWLNGKRNVRIKPKLNNFACLKMSLPDDGRSRVIYLSWSEYKEDVEASNPLAVVSAPAVSEESVVGEQGQESTVGDQEPRVGGKEPTKPVVTENASKSESGYSDSKSDESKSFRVMLVEDDERYADLLSGLLEKNDFLVTHFVDAERAFEQLTAVKPDLIISDVHLPSISGAEFTKKVREENIQSPILVLTSDDRILLEAELVDLGADAFLRKDEDVRVILSWCKNLGKRSAVAPAGASIDGSAGWTIH